MARVPLHVLNPAGIEQRSTRYPLLTPVQKTGPTTQLSSKIRAVGKKKETKSTKSFCYHPTRQKSKDTCEHKHFTVPVVPQRC
ncbi:hypothetical protein AA0116_g91 [Alternaria tenuissima]|nr:hypothetical protein AA0116_g91 [Alternaria tenuissima]